MEQKDPLVEVLNLGSGAGSSVLDVINTFEQVSGKPLNWKFGARREGDIEAIFANPKKAADLIGWSTSRTIQDAIADAWRWEVNIKVDVV